MSYFHRVALAFFGLSFGLGGIFCFLIFPCCFWSSGEFIDYAIMNMGVNPETVSQVRNAPGPHSVSGAFIIGGLTLLAVLGMDWLVEHYKKGVNHGEHA